MCGHITQSSKPCPRHGSEVLSVSVNPLGQTNSFIPFGVNQIKNMAIRTKKKYFRGTFGTLKGDILAPGGQTEPYKKSEDAYIM